MTNYQNMSSAALGRYEMKMPESICLYTKSCYRETLDAFAHIDSYPKKTGIFVTLDFTDTKNMTAAAATYLFTIITEVQYFTSPNYFSIKLPKNQKAKDMFINSGFSDSLKKEGLSKIPYLWKHSNFICGDNDDRSRLISNIKSKSKLDPLPDKLASAIKETLLNINHHAYKRKREVTWWCYSYSGEDKNGKFLIAVIIDKGEGIPETIRKSFTSVKTQVNGRSYQLIYDHECILLAMQTTVTSTDEEGRGEGSKNIKGPIICGNNDVLLVISSAGAFNYKCKEGEVVEASLGLPDKLKGTLVEWKLYY